MQPASRSSSAAVPVNVGWRLSETAARDPQGIAIAEPAGRGRDGRRRYRQITFAELEDDTNRIAAGLQAMGVEPGTRFVLLVRPGIDFISLVFALFKAGIVTVLIDPGMGRRHLIRCLSEAQPEGFVAIPLAHFVRQLFARRFPLTRHLVTVGSRWFWGGTTLATLRKTPATAWRKPRTLATDPAAIIFTTGSTGPPKGVLYEHGNFDRQVDELRAVYQIEPGEIDLPGFPLFALFNAVMGVTTVIPEMDFTRPAAADPRKILEIAQDWQVTQAFGSPALLNLVGRHCEQTAVRLPSLRRVLSAGAPVPPHVLRRMQAAISPHGEIHTPYGATEALPVATISAREVLQETAARSEQGQGTCVGRRFPGIEWRIIPINDGPVPRFSATSCLPQGEIGELIVRGPVVTRQYVTRLEANPLHKISDSDTFWHRMGDVGYLDEQDRFWFCGRKSHRVQTGHSTLYTIPCEAIFNRHPRVYRSALVGVGPAGQQRPVIIVEPWPESRSRSTADMRRFLDELRDLAQSHSLTRSIQDFFLRDHLPVDIRHNAKIFREKLAIWVAPRLGRLPSPAKSD